MYHLHVCEFLDISTSFILQGPPVGLGRFQAPRLPVVKGLWRDWSGDRGRERKRERGERRRKGGGEGGNEISPRPLSISEEDGGGGGGERNGNEKGGNLPLSSFPSSNQTKTWLAGEGKGRRLRKGRERKKF